MLEADNKEKMHIIGAVNPSKTGFTLQTNCVPELKPYQNERPMVVPVEESKQIKAVMATVKGIPTGLRVGVTCTD